MTWTSFVNYVLMCELGQDDAIIRNYDLDYCYGDEGSRVSRLTHACWRIGLEKASWPVMVSQVAQWLVNCGYKPPCTERIVELIQQWYIHDRIRKGEIHQWPRKKVRDLILG